MIFPKETRSLMPLSIVVAIKFFFFLNNGNNHYSITRSAAITEYLKTACHMFFYTVDL